MIDPEFLQLKQGFLQGLEQRLERLLKAWQQKDLQAFHKEVHNLSGASGAYGLDAVSQQARLLERQAWALMQGVEPDQASEYPGIQASLDTLVSLAEAEIPSGARCD